MSVREGGVSECLEMQARSKIGGGVDCSLVEMQQGVVVEGRLIHRGGREGLN